MTEHKTPTSTLFATLIALMVLLALSVVASKMLQGAAATTAALAIAVAKALLVGWIFMDLRRSSPLTRLIAVSGLFWLLIMVVLTAMDFATRGM